MLNIVKGYHLQLKSQPLFFCSFNQFNIKAALVHHSVIQKELHELLAKAAIEPYKYAAGFYSNSFVILQHTSGL